VAETHTFLFADMAGYTAMTEAHGDEDAADLAATFCDEIDELLPEYDAENVKSIGDAVMVHGRDVRAAVQLGLRVVRDVGGRHGFPAVRVGIHTGPAVERNGDWFGAAVNIAARVSGVAGGGEVLVTEAVRTASGDLSDVEWRRRGEHTLKNVSGAVVLYQPVLATERDDQGFSIDPVCRMAVDPQHAAGVLVHEGSEYHFCSLTCVRAFAAAPEEYAR
jgi:adenylate cyclase